MTDIILSSEAAESELLARSLGWREAWDEDQEPRLLVVYHPEHGVHFTGAGAWGEAAGYVEPLTAEGEAYVAGWAACVAGVDGRYANPHSIEREGSERYAWDAGFLDAMEAEEGEEPDPAAAGFCG